MDFDYLFKDGVIKKEEFDRPDNYEFFLEELFLSCDIEYKTSDKFFLIRNPFSSDGSSYSAQVWKDDGNFKTYDVTLKVTRRGKEVLDSSFSLTEFVRMLGMMNLYIDYIMQFHNISKSDFIEYKELLINFTFFNKYSKKLEIYRRKFFDFYITDSDIMRYDSDKPTKTFDYPDYVKNKKEVEKAPILYTEPNDFYKMKCKAFMSKRKIPLSETVYPIMIKFPKSENQAPAIAIEYPNGFRKIRLIDGNLRYIADTSIEKYSVLYPSRNIGTETAYVVEGEFEGMVLSEYIKDDVFSLHNTLSVPNTKQLINYKNIIIKLDFDKFAETSKNVIHRIKAIAPYSNVSISPKVELLKDDGKKLYDYNDLHILGKLKDFLDFGVSKII